MIKGTRISVELVIELLAAGYTPQQIIEQYDHLTAEDIRACLAYAKEVVRVERVYAVRRYVHAFAGERECPGPVVRRVRELGHDVLWAKEDLRGHADHAVLSLAQTDQRIIVTCDTDLVNWLSRRSPSHMWGRLASDPLDGPEHGQRIHGIRADEPR